MKRLIVRDRARRCCRCMARHRLAQTLRWASQGDPQTMDPHSQNESMTNMMNGQVYERLIRRDRRAGHRAGAGHRVGADRPADLALQAAPGRQVPRRLRR